MLHSKAFKLAMCVAACLLGIGSTSSARAEAYTLTDLGGLVPGSTSSAAFGINNSGQVVGWSNGINGTRQATLWSGDVATVYPAPLPPWSTTAAAINNAGQMVGYETGTAFANAILWSGGVATALASSGRFDFAYAINDRGQVVGSQAPLGAPDEATEWRGGVVTDLGQGDALGINDRGQVVGYSGPSPEATEWSGGHVI